MQATTDMAEAEAEAVMVAVDSGGLLHIKQHSKGNATIVVSGVIKRLTVGSYRIEIRETETVLPKMKLVVLPWRLC